MGVLNRDPQLAEMFKKLDERIRSLEAMRRFTIPVIPNYTKIPQYPQSGDCFIDATTGYLYVFLVLTGDGYTGLSSTSSITIGTGSRTFATTNTGSFTVGDPITIFQTGNSANFMTGFVTGLTANSQLVVRVDVTGGSGTFSSWTMQAAGAWRQLATYADFIAQNVFFATSSCGSAIASAQSIAGGGTGSGTSGSTTGSGGIGYILASGYPPR